ncbi:hypothetical protein MSNKSG1_07143 [Marinobacter santoriniensis NKSG1]|uniref:Cell division coordinator CpoB n=2 Tax=Marinobacter santoriniensis TaxID=523742 RepID=M7CPN7_9GAMM|nr:hypothetical protein MSNKSG1_07143 [Marinobacter santoriniensis NKSG1]
MAPLLMSLAFWQAAPALAQSSTPAFQTNASEAQRKASNNQASAELFYMIQQLQDDVRRLQGKVEEQQHLIERLQKQGRDRYIDLDQRILDLSKKTESASQPAATGASGETEGGGGAIETRQYRQPGDEEQKAYNEILDLIRNQKKYDQAINRLYEFIDKYPEGDLTVNAYYWLGEVYLVKPQLEQAKQAFTIVATRYPDHRKAPDAVYKLGVTLDRMGDSEAAKRRMQSVLDNYPKSSAADLARKFLSSASG